MPIESSVLAIMIRSKLIFLSFTINLHFYCIAENASQIDGFKDKVFQNTLSGILTENRAGCDLAVFNLFQPYSSKKIKRK